MPNNNYQIVTDRIVTMLENGVRPWSKPWSDGVAPTAQGRPLRSNGQPYTGINTLNLWCAAQARGFASSHWFTFKGARDAGGNVRKGAKAELAFYVGSHTIQEDDGTERSIGFLKTYCVFNTDEIEGLPLRFAPPVQPAAPAEPSHVDSYISATGASIVHGGDRAFYSPSGDYIRLPMQAQFSAADRYYSVALHELVHWTGHASRCDRSLSGRFGDAAYAAEELIAELGAAFLCADLGLSAEPREDHASYIASWISVLKSDNRAVFKAAALAEKAAAYLSAPREAAALATPSFKYPVLFIVQ